MKDKIKYNKTLKFVTGVLTVAFLILLASWLFIKDKNKTPVDWQNYQTNQTPLVAVLGQITQGAKAAVKIDQTNGEVGFGVKKYDGQKLQLFTKMEGGNFSKPIQEDNKVKWLGVLPGIDVEVHTFDGKVKEFIHINNKEAAHSFTFNLDKNNTEIELRDEGGMYLTAIDKKTGEELFTLDYPIAIDANGKKIPYHYSLVKSSELVQEADRLILEVHDQKLLDRIKYPLVLDPPMTVREYDEMLVKIGQNGEAPSNAKDGDIVNVKPEGWPWGDMEYRDYVIVRVPKMTEEEREKFLKRFQSITNEERVLAMKNHQAPPQSQTQQLDGAYQYGLDYVALLNNSQVKVYQRQADGLEKEINKDGVVDAIRDRGQEHPIIDATSLSLGEIFQSKKFVTLYNKIKQGELKLALNDLPADESILPQATRLAQRIEEKKSWLAKLADKIIKPVWAATNTYTIGTSGRNYSTLQAWEDARDGSLSAIEKGECYNDSTFTAGVGIDGSTTSASNYMWLTVAADNRHNGTAGTGVVVDPDTPYHVMTAADDYTIIDWFEVTGFSADGSAYAGISSYYASYTTLRYNLVHDNIHWGTSIGLEHYGTGGDNLIYDNFVYSGTAAQAFAYGIYTFYETGTGSLYVYNNTVFLPMDNGGGYGGIGDDNAIMLAKNNLVSESSGSISAFSGSFAAGSDYNAGSDTSAPGDNSIDNVVAGDTFSSLASGSENLHLKAGASALNAGLDLSAIFTTDIDGETRPTGALTWDIGADEIVVEEPPAAGATNAKGILKSGTIKVKGGIMKLK